MKLTKYAHACIVLEQEGQKLIIDPGVFTPELGDISNVAAVVVTHIHPDHFNTEHLQTILAQNPEAKIFTPSDVAAQFSHANVQAVAAGHTQQVGPFNLRFLGEKHQLIHSSLPCPQNTAVMVNDTFFCPGDSFTQPDKPVVLLAIPANAPWCSVADSIDYLLAVKPARCIPTHNGLLSDAGNMVYNGALTHASKLSGSVFEYLQPGQSTEV